jgi:hypothetical protein
METAAMFFGALSNYRESFMVGNGSLLSTSNKLSLPDNDEELKLPAKRHE